MKQYLLNIYFFNLLILIQSSQKWLPEVNGYSDYTGIIGNPITSLRVSGKKEYRVHTLNGEWLPAVTRNDENEPNNGYAGLDNQPIDGVSIKSVTYKVHILSGSWLDEVNIYDVNDSLYGMAVIYGKNRCNNDKR